MLMLAVIPFLMLSSCAEEGDMLQDIPNEEGRCATTIRLEIDSFGMNGIAGTRAMVGGSDDENTIANIWVFQYNVETGRLMRDPAYYDDFNSNDIETDLTNNVNGQHSVVCIVANIGKGGVYEDEGSGTGESSSGTTKETWALDEHGNTKDFFQTYEGFLTHAIPASATRPFISSNMGGEDGKGKVIPMFGESKQMVIASKCYVSIPLVRMFARVSVDIDKANLEEHKLTLQGIEVQNIPSYCRVSSLVKDAGYNHTMAATYPEDIEWVSYTTTANKATLYIPENLQGIVAGMSGKQETDGYKIPGHALRVEITVSYQKDGEVRTHTYAAYPGYDMENDFNISRNHIYNVRINITKQPEE